MPASDDAMLVRALRSPGGGDAARALYRAHGRELFAFALHRLGERAGAEEVVREVFERAAAGGDPGRGTVRAWLLGLAAQAVAERERRGAAPAPGESAEGALLRWQVEAALGRLTDEHREVLRLAHHGRLSIAEIAQLTGVAEEAVASRAHFALHGLRLALDEMGAL